MTYNDVYKYYIDAKYPGIDLMPFGVWRGSLRSICDVLKPGGERTRMMNRNGMIEYIRVSQVHHYRNNGTPHYEWEKDFTYREIQKISRGLSLPS